MTFHFIRPLLLLLIPVALLVWFLWRRSTDPLRGWRSVMDAELLASMVTGNHSRWLGIGRLCAWLLAVIAIAGPTWKPEPSPFSDDPAPVMILLKADGSMNAEDFAPNRMERARLKAVDFSNLRNGRPTGLIVYAGTAHLVLPPTRDTEVVADMARHISPDIMPEPGNNLNAAIRLAEEHMTGGALVVIADTVPEYTAERPISILAVSRQQLKNTIPITADSADVEMLDRRTAGTPVAIKADGEPRWKEEGYSLVPILGIFVLFQFRGKTE